MKDFQTYGLRITENWQFKDLNEERKILEVIFEGLLEDIKIQKEKVCCCFDHQYCVDIIVLRSSLKEASPILYEAEKRLRARNIGFKRLQAHWNESEGIKKILELN